MIREIAVFLYLLVFRSVFSFFKLLPQNKKTIFIVYLGYDSLYTIKALEKQTNEPIIIIKNKHCRVSFSKTNGRTVLDLSHFNLLTWLKFVYHLATSNKVVVDNYYGFLSSTKFKKNTLCVQLWHATGALKKFGYEDISILNRSKFAIERFKKVYASFTHVIVGSDTMSDIFSRSFGTTEEKILRTGIPRTDFFYNEELMSNTRSKLLEDYPQLKEKKIILYAPTFRDGVLQISDFPFSIEKMRQELGEEYILVLKTHPLISSNLQSDYSTFVLNLSNYTNINDLLLVTDVLISDYSSIPFEFSFLEKPMIFYAYDLDDYRINRGLCDDYEKMVPGPVVQNTNDLIDVLKNKKYDINKIISFKEEWNTYSTGNSSDRVAKFLINREI